MNLNNAGGTDGGSMRFLIGTIIICGGGYLLLNSITVLPSFGFGSSVFSLGGVSVTSGTVLIPFLFGVGMVFYNSKNWLGWLLSLGSLTALIFGVLANLNIHVNRMSGFDLIVLLVGGIGLFLSSLHSHTSK